MIGIEMMLGNLRQREKKRYIEGENRKVQNSVVNIIYVHKDDKYTHAYILGLYTEYFCTINK